MSANLGPEQGPRRPRVAVVFGGRSSEHAISCVTAAGVLKAIDAEAWDVVPIGITPTGRWVLASDDPKHWQIEGGELPRVDEDEGPGVVIPLQAGAGSVITDTGTVLPFTPQAFASTRLRHLRPGQRLTVTVEGSGAQAWVTAMRLGNVAVVPRRTPHP
mgnify:CR=1 FL=1